MIRFFRRYQKTVFGILIFLSAILMVSFGVDFTRNGSSRQNKEAAIQIDDQVITHQEFYEKKREVEARYRQMFGAQYDTLAKQFNMNIPQSVVDGLIDNTLLVRDARDRGFRASDDELVSTISRMFPGGYDPSVLRASGQSPEAFLKNTEDSIIRAQFEGMLKDSAISSAKEAHAEWSEKNTAYSVGYVELDPKNFIAQVKDPTDEELKNYYTDHSDDFKLPARIAYDYVAFRPEGFMPQIEVPEDEIEFYYTDNQSKFENPEQLKLQHIQLLYPKDTDPKTMAEVKQKAGEVYEKAKAGEPFDSLVQKYSDDYTTRSSNGELGWVPKGRYGKEFDEKTYKVKDGGLAELIETNYGFHIVKVEGHKDSSLKPLSEAKAEIETTLKKEQAPAYADTKAREFLDQFTGGEKPLAELAKEKGFTAISTNGLLDEKTDPEATLKGLTAKVLEASTDLKQFVELRDVSIVVAVRDQKEPEVPPLASVKEAVVAKYKKSQSIILAKAKADALLEKLKAGPDKLLEVVAKGAQIPFQKNSGLTISGKLPDPLTEEGFRDEIFVSGDVPAVPKRIIASNGKFYLVQALDKKTPDAKTAKPEDFVAAAEQNTQTLASMNQKSYVESLKEKAKIVVDNSILNSEL